MKNNDEKNGGAVKQLHPVIIIIVDILLSGIALCTFAFFHHVIRWEEFDSDRVEKALTDMTFPEITRKPSEPTARQTSAASAFQGDTTIPYTASQTSTTVAATESSDGIFTDGEIISDETTYRSKYVSVSQTELINGGHRYYVIDINVRSMDCFATAVVPKERFNDFTLKLAEENNAVCAINGDYFALVNGGCAIRNGCVLSTGTDNEVCVLYLDGRMEIYPPDTFDDAEAIKNGAWQAWDFGPSMLSEDSKAIEHFQVRRDIAGKHPRSALGYYSPGHYCFVTVGGRKPGGSDGVTLEELSATFEKLGCAKAYNLDGGRSAVMTFGDRIVNEKENGEGRRTTDILFIRDRAKQGD